MPPISNWSQTHPNPKSNLDISVVRLYSNEVSQILTYSFKGLATLDGNTLTIVTQTEKGEIRRTLEFTDTGINMVNYRNQGK